MAKKKITKEEAAALTRKLFHFYYAGNLEPWFSYLCTDSVYIGTGEPILFGGDAIRKHFEHYEGVQIKIINDEYFPVILSENAALVYGRIVVKSEDHPSSIITHFTVISRVIGSEIKIVYQHNSYEQSKLYETTAMPEAINTTQFVRNLLLEQPFNQRFAVQSGKQTLFINPFTILYVQSHGKNTDLICIDRIIHCNRSIGELAKELPAVFYQIHRGYLVNTRYITAIRRFEVELLSGITLPIPALTYMQVKQDLQAMLQA